MHTYVNVYDVYFIPHAMAITVTAYFSIKGSCRVEKNKNKSEKNSGWPDNTHPPTPFNFFDTCTAKKQTKKHKISPEKSIRVGA